MSKIDRLSALVTALSALTLEDIESFDVQDLCDLRNKAQHQIQYLKNSEESAKNSEEILATPIGLSAREWQHVQNGKKIEAIHAFRARTNSNLITAKEHVEQIAYNYGVPFGINHGIGESLAQFRIEMYQDHYVSYRSL